jgi:outer membrane protein TolC
VSPCLRAALVGTLLCLGPSAAGLAAQQEPLDALVAEGLARNPDLRRAEHQLDQADAAVREATGRWLPALTLTARYSERSGNILDIGEMVNPAFRALNQLLGQDAFPTDVSLKQPFKQETGLRLTQPLFQPAVAAGVGVAREGRAAEAAGLVGERRALAARIRLAYLDYARAVRVEELFTATLGLLTENLRVHTALLAQGVITPDALLRARADHSEGLQRQADAANLRTSAREAFNLLLDRPAAAPLELLPDSLLGITAGMGQDSAVAAALRGRTELRQLDHGIAAAAGAERYASAAFLPSLVAAVDWGIQGDRYRFRGSQDFLVASLVLQWNLFNGGQDQARRQQARARRDALVEARRWAAGQVALETRAAWRAAEVARLNESTAADRLASAARSYELVERKFREGAAAQVELIDARTASTAAALNQILTHYDHLARRVELERAAGLYPHDGGQDR